MTVLESILLGVLQGVTEFIPVSSSGHLIVMRELMGLGDIPILFDVMLHIATLIVIVFFFRARVVAVFRSSVRWVFRRHTDADAIDLVLARLIVIATIITGVGGYLIAQLDLERFPRLAAAFFLVTAAILIASRFARGSRGYDSIRTRDGVFIALAQVFAVLPGISRSGTTITTGLFCGLGRREAGEFSFLISIPAMLGALLYTLRDVGDLTLVVTPVALVAGFLASGIAGYFALGLLVKLIRGGRLWVFSVYLIPLGIIGLFLF
ncbi:MAG: undecaprenyl-diphosphate phosphatase [Spirochaetaceae bacterium]|nr:MAG: undecaprenyl-diphosphate phosphatase [Spirochaetaceae bacterium]